MPRPEAAAPLLWWRPTAATFAVAMNRLDVVDLDVDLVDVELDVDLVDVDLDVDLVDVDLVDVDLDVEVSNFRIFDFSSFRIFEFSKLIVFAFSKMLISRVDALDRLYRSE